MNARSKHAAERAIERNRAKLELIARTESAVEAGEECKRATKRGDFKAALAHNMKQSELLELLDAEQALVAAPTSAANDPQLNLPPVISSFDHEQSAKAS